MEVDITDIVTEHMERQPYFITCKCGEELEYKRTIDKDLDMTLVVDPCEKCTEEAKDEGRNEG